MLDYLAPKPKNSRITMKQPGFTIYEKAALSSLDFYAYEDPVVDTLRQWEVSGDMWNESMRYLYHTAITAELFAKGEEELAQTQAEYGQHFTQALATIAADSPIEEIAVPTIEQYVRDEDARRRERLRNWYTRMDLPEPSDEYFYDIAMAFGDPQGNTLPYDSTYTIFDTNIATEMFLGNLSDQSERVLGGLRHCHNMRQQTPKPPYLRTLGATVLRAMKRFGK